MLQCRICKANKDFQSIRGEYVYGGNKEHKFWRCGKCDAVYLYPVPTEEEDEYFYKNEFAKFAAKRSSLERDWSNAEAHIRNNQDHVKRRWDFLRPHLHPEMDLMEIGCSSGFMLNAFRDAKLNCVGIEPSGEFIEFLAKQDHLAFKSLKDLKLIEPEKKFDLITHFFVLEHIRDPFQFMKETLTFLKPNGKIIAEIPCVDDPLATIFNIPAFEKFYWAVGHHYYYSPKSLSYILDSLDLNYELLPEQRYDLSNHITWMMEGVPGGQGKYNHIFSDELINIYKRDLKEHWICDTIFLIVYNRP